MRSGGDHASKSYSYLSLRDLLDARDQYHIHLMRHPNVVATAIGRYRIRIKDSWPTDKSPGKVHGTYARTLQNSHVRYYSWPAILVFVRHWENPDKLGPGELVPKTLYLPDGRSVPVCVIEAPKEEETKERPAEFVYPVNNIGGGWPVIAEVQGRHYVATIACLVSNGHTVYALTNRHVAGEPGEIVYSMLNGKQERIGVSSAKSLTRAPFASHYPGWPGRNVFINLDVGLIEVDNLDRWTAKVRNVGQIGKMVDLSIDNISLDLIGCNVRGTGAATGEMHGEIAALFYRYKTNGGFEYVADAMIGPRPETENSGPEKAAFKTLPGDSGTLWLLEFSPDDNANGKNTQKKRKPTEYLPIAMQWGRNMLYSADRALPQSYVLATFMSRVCAELEVDPVRNWNLDQPDTWSAIGHFAIASYAQFGLSTRLPKLVKLMKNNALIISHDDDTIRAAKFTGLGSASFVPLSDVPDFFWKPRIAKQGHARAMEGPNHFADMDQPDEHGKTLLDYCKDVSFIDPAKWNDFYDSIVDLASNEPIEMSHRGLLPFRVWQIFDAMMRFVAEGRAAEYVCAAGTLTHYIGDACQPLHISYLHDGDPQRIVQHRFKRGDRAGETEDRIYGAGVHTGYEDSMISANREKVLEALKHTPKATRDEMIRSGFEAAQLTIDLMRETFKSIPPADIVREFAEFDGTPRERSEYLWKKFGTKTLKNMQKGSHLLAVLWESAWLASDGEKNVRSLRELSQDEAMEICADPEFMPSASIAKIDRYLEKGLVGHLLAGAA